MRRDSVLPFGATKEIRALSPAWVACILTVAAGAVVDDPRLQGLGLLAYGLGSLALGAQSIGHEYTHHTLAMLLAQPTDRRRLLLVKLGVLTSMLMTLGAVAWIVLSDNGELLGTSIWRQPSVLSLAAVCGLFVAPWLTMVCRSPLAGVVFTIAMPMCLLVLGDVLAVAKYGFDGGAEIDRFKLIVFWWGILGLCVVAAVSGWRMFMRLEAIEGRGPEVRMPRWLGRRIRPETTFDAPALLPVRMRHPVWLLAKKELRLQQMTFVVVGLYILMWATLSFLKQFAPELPRLPLAPLTVLYFGLLSILIGSLASAEERQFGTLEWQVLLPMATWRQWVVKAGTTLGLAVVLGMGLPMVLMAIHGLDEGFRGATRVVRETLPAVVLLTASSLYVSSLCTSGIRAMILSLPAIVGTLFLFLTVSLAVDRAVFLAFTSRGARVSRGLFVAHAASQRTVMLLLAAGLVALLLRYALINHRSAERNSSRILRQVAGIAGLLTFGVLLLAGVTIFYFSRFQASR